MNSSKVKKCSFSLLTKGLIDLDRNSKTLLVIFTDYFLLVFSFWISLCIRSNQIYIPSGESYALILLGPFIAIPIFYSFGLYSSLIRYSNYQSILKLMLAVTIYSAFWFVAVITVGVVDKPYDFLVINWLVSVFLSGGIRYIARWFLSFKQINSTNVIIYGAGSSGIQIQSALSHSPDMKVVAFIDDNKKLKGKSIEGVRVFDSQELPDLINNKDIREVLLAMPSVTKSRKGQILNYLKKYPLVIRSLPDINDIAQGKVLVSDLKTIKIEDLLRRDVRQPSIELLTKEITKKNVLITGAGGSIGSELCKQIALVEPNLIILFDISELALYSIERKLKENTLDAELIVVLGDILDKSKLIKIINQYKIDTFFHAAAYKHVPLVEKNIVAGVNTNIFGTLSCIEAAIDQKVNSFVFISTDKAVRPTNIMGATKRFAEIVLQSIASIPDSQNQTKISIVRFGNVLGSSGSVVPLFHEQIRKGGPITITDPNIIRYFMTVSEAAQLVIQAGAMESEGDIFLLDMGDPVEIVNLAKDMIKLSGKTLRDKDDPEGDIEIVYTGLRPGEKLFEELLIGEDATTTEHPRIMKASEGFLDSDQLDHFLSKLSSAKASEDIDVIKDIFNQTVDGYEI